MANEANKKKKARAANFKDHLKEFYRKLFRIDDIIMTLYMDAYQQHNDDHFNMDTAQMKETADCINMIIYATELMLYGLNINWIGLRRYLASYFRMSGLFFGNC